MERDEQDIRRARLRAHADRERYALLRVEREGDAAARGMARDLRGLDAEVEDAKREVADELRREHFGHDPERPLPWPPTRRDGT